MKTSHIAVLIVGAGPVGLATAALLRQHGIEVRIIEKNAGPTPYSKAIGVHARTLESMHALDLTEQLIDDGHPMHAFRLNEAGRTIMSAGFGHIDSPYGFVLGLPQSRTERRLLLRLQQLGGGVDWETTLTRMEQWGNPADPTQPAVVRVKNSRGMEELVSCNWLIGADGSRSSVRELAGIDFPGGDYGNAFILGDVKIDWDGQKNELQFFLSRNGYLLVVPMPDGMHRLIAQMGKSYEDFQKSERPQATLEDLQRIVDANGPGDIRVHSPQWLTCAPFYHRRAETPVRGRIVLAGDAYHLFSPLGAQGLNTGFQDAFNLTWKLAFIEKGWGDPELLVNSYQDERDGIAKLIAAVTSKTTKYITATSLPKRLYRQWATRYYNKTERVQSALPRLLAGLMQSYGRSAFLSGGSADGLPQAGSRIPHAWLPDGRAQRPIASLIHGTKYSLLLMRNCLDDNAIESIERFWHDANRACYPFLQLIVISRETASWQARLPQDCGLIDDRLGSMFKALREYREAMLLVRPDGFCALSSKQWSFDDVARYFKRRSLHGSSADIQKGLRHAA